MRENRTPLLLGALAALCSACGPQAELPDPSVAQATGAVRRPFECDEMLCTSNSPVVGGLKFWELDASGAQSNSAGIRLAAVAKDGNLLTLDFTGALVPGHGAWPVASGPGGSYQGAGLVNAVLRLATPSGFVPVTISAFKQVGYYDEDPNALGTLNRIAVFQLTYPKPGVAGVRLNLCPHETVDDFGLAGTWAVLSRGDRFDNTDISIKASGLAVGSWFNVSCAGDAIAKLLRIRHAGAAENALHSTTKAQRQAALNMFTARYCPGSRHLYTSVGTPLHWADAAGWAPPMDLSQPEAIWTESGALCLTQPRKVSLSEVACATEACTPAQLAAWQTEGSFLSALPPP